MQTAPSFNAPENSAPENRATGNRAPDSGVLPTRTVSNPFLLAAALGGAVSVAIGTYGRVHTPTGHGIVAFGFPAVLPMKAWFTTVAAVLVIGQLVSALWLYGRLPRTGAAPSWVAPVHRWSGTAAFLVTLPVAYHCLWALGFQDSSPRVLVHSLLGCAFYGVFATKMLVLRSDHVPDWALPLTGAAFVTVLAAIWTTSSLWFFQNFGFPGV